MATLNKFFTNLMLLGLSLSIITYLFGVYVVDPQFHLPFTPLTTWTSWFDFSPWNILLTGGAIGAIGLAAVLLRQGTYAIYAMLLVALTMIITPIKEIITAVPLSVSAWFVESTNPTPGAANPIYVVVSLLFVVAAYWFIFGLVVQRDIT